MLWLAYVGLGLIGVGAAFAAIGMTQYIDYQREVERMMESGREACKNMVGEQADRCGKGMAYGLAFNSYKEDDAFLSLIVGAALGSIGVAVFAIGYQRSWITNIVHRPKN